MTETLTPLLVHSQAPGQYAPSLAEKRADGMDRIHHETRIISRFSPSIYPAEVIGLQSQAGNSSAKVIGEIALPSPDTAEEDHIAVLQVTHSDGRTLFALQGLTPKQDEQGDSYFWKSDTTIIPITETGIVLGKSGDNEQQRVADRRLVSSEQLWSNHQYSPETSRQQVLLSLENEHLLIQDTSSNGTGIVGGSTLVSEQPPVKDHIAQHTSKGNVRAMAEGLMNDAGEFAGRKVITRDTTLGGKNPEATVDIRSWQAGGEAIVVDPGADPEMYDRLRTNFLGQLKIVSGKKRPNEEQVITAIYEAVGSSMEYDLAYVDKEMQTLSQERGSHRKVNLEVYLDAGKGVCRHMALAAAWLGGEAAVLGLLSGRLTAEVNQRKADNAAHEWARYTDVHGLVFIIDPAQKFVGRLEDSLKDKRWEYFRQNEKEQYLQRLGSMTENHASVAEPASKSHFKKLFGK